MCGPCCSVEVCHLFRCLGDRWSSRVSPLATAFLCLRKSMKFLKVALIFIFLTRFPNSNELYPGVYHLVFAA